MTRWGIITVIMFAHLIVHLGASSCFIDGAQTIEDPLRSSPKDWLYEPVQEVQGNPGNVIMLLDEEDQPHIIYGKDDGLSHSMFNGDVWSHENVPGTNNMTWDVCAALDKDGRPHIAYISPGFGLNRSWKDDDGWNIMTVDPDFQAMPSIGTDSKGLVHIAYRVGYELRCAQCNGTEVAIVTIGTGNFYGISLNVDSSDRVYISASNRSGPSFGRLELFQRTIYGWGRSTINEGQGAFSYTLLRLDRLDRPRICYTVRTTVDRVDMVALDGATWSHFIVDEEVERVLFDFQLGSDDAPNIIADNIHGQWTGTKWVFTPIDIAGLVWSSQCMAFDSLGNIHLSVVLDDDHGPVVAHLIFGFDINRPLSNAGEDRDLEIGEMLVLDGSLSSDDTDISRWLWTIRYGNLTLKREGVRVELDTFMLGPHYITLRVVDTSGNFDDDAAVINVRDMTGPIAVAGNDLTIEQHTLVRFNGSGSTDWSNNLNFTWTIEDPSNSSMVILYGPSPSFMFHEAGSFEVVLMVNDSSGNVGTDSFMVTVIDITPPRISGILDRALPQYSILHLDASGCSDNVGIAEYNWTVVRLRSTWHRSGVNVSILLGEAGEYDVVLTVFDSSGNKNSTSFTVLCLDRDPPIARFECMTSFRKGEVLELDGSPSTDNLGIVTWAWAITNGDEIREADGQIASFTLTSTGNHTVLLTVTDGEGNIGTTTRYVMVIAAVEPGLDDGEGLPSWSIPALLGISVILAIATIAALVVIYRRKDGPEPSAMTPAPSPPLSPRVEKAVLSGERPKSRTRTMIQTPQGMFSSDNTGPLPFDGRSGMLEGPSHTEE